MAERPTSDTAITVAKRHPEHDPFLHAMFHNGRAYCAFDRGNHEWVNKIDIAADLFFKQNGINVHELIYHPLEPFFRQEEIVPFSLGKYSIARMALFAIAMYYALEEESAKPQTSISKFQRAARRTVTAHEREPEKVFMHQEELTDKGCFAASKATLKVENPPDYQEILHAVGWALDPPSDYDQKHEEAKLSAEQLERFTTIVLWTYQRVFSEALRISDQNSQPAVI